MVLDVPHFTPHHTTPSIDRSIHPPLNTPKITSQQEALVSLPGVGRKVADCVALFSLDQMGAVPVDVHVRD